jgi:hypothetical protein
MANIIKIRRGNKVNLPPGGTREGEPRYTKDTKGLYIDDGEKNVLIGGPEALDRLTGDIKAIKDSKNEPNGIAGLDDSGKIPVESMPGGLAVVEVRDYSLLPQRGKENTIYITDNDNRMYRWNSVSNTYTSLKSTSSGGTGGGIATSLYSFDVDDEGYLCLYYEDGVIPPQMFIDSDGYLWVDINGDELPPPDAGGEPVPPTIVEYARFVDLPTPGEPNTVYHIVSTNKYYTWNGINYILYNS